MDKNAIKKFAVWARRELIARVSQKAEQYGITEKNTGDIKEESVNGRLLTQAEQAQRVALIYRIRQDGFQQVMEEVAYTWFNRICALRFMEVNNYLPTRIRVFTDEENTFKPQILAEAIHMEMDGLDMDKVYQLKSDNKTEELYKYLLITQCNALYSILPGMFQQIADYTELLLPDNLLREGSVIEQMITLIPEEDWLVPEDHDKDSIQIIGWLYQYYNAEPKDQVFANLKKNIKISKHDIPAATQLFTPDWIVRYMVENSLGRLWVEGHPDDELKAGWKYYLEEAEQEPDVQAQLAKIREEYAAIKPEDIKCIDPCMGSGHILVYMFDVLVQIYQAYGYSTREAVQSIVENNLYGLDIDDRAAQLAYFAVMMKARQYDRRFFTRGIQPHVCAIQESVKMPEDAWDYFGTEKDIAQRVYMAFADAKEYGSLIEPNVTLAELDALDARLTEMDHMADYGNLAVQALMGTVLIVMEPLLKQARVLVQRYDTVISNPPYMNSNSMSPKLLSFAKKNYPLTWADMFSTCMEKGLSMTKPNRYMAMITMESWMFLSTFEDFRRSILKRDTISSLIHMPYLGKGGTSLGIAFGNCAFVVKTESMSKYKAHYECIRYYETDDNGIPFSFPMHNERFGHKAQEGFSAISSASISYWASENMLKVFRERKTLLNYMDARSGISTGDNNMFYRCWFECEAAKIAFDSAYTPSNSNYKWFPTIRGGDFRKWYGNMENVLNLQNEGYAIRTSGKNYRLRTPAFYNKRGITWNRISSRDVSFRLKTEQVNFGENSPCMFLDEKQVLTLMGFLNSIVAKAMLECINSTMTYQVLDIQSIPYIPAQRDDIDQIVGENIRLAKEDWDAFEKSWDYQEHPFVRIAKKHGSSELTLRQIFELWSEECNDRFNRVRRNEELLNKYYIDVYNLAEVLSPNVAEEDVTIKKADLKRDIRSFISYAIGCLLGRYSLSKPGLVFAGGILNAHDYGKGIVPDKDNILPICDDEYFDDDIVGKFVRFVEIVFGKSNLDENISYIAEALGGSASPKDVIRMYFLNEFFADHCANYFVTSVGKRPIYWLFDSGKQNGFKALIYMHRYAPDTIARIRTDYVHEQQSRYRTAIADLENRIVSASTGERVKLTKQLNKVKAQDEELRLYEEKIHHLADQMISIDLDDGVKVNYAKFADVLAKIK